MRRFYRKGESEVRLRNYTNFYVEQPKPEPCFEHLSARKVFQKRKKRQHKLRTRQMEDLHRPIPSRKRNNLLLLPRLESRSVYMADVSSSDHESIRSQSRDSHSRISIPPRPIRPTDRIRAGEIYDVYGEIVTNAETSISDMIIDVKMFKKRKVSIPTEISELAHIQISEIICPNSEKSSLLNSTIIGSGPSAEPTLPLQRPEPVHFRRNFRVETVLSQKLAQQQKSKRENSSSHINQLERDLKKYDVKLNSQNLKFANSIMSKAISPSILNFKKQNKLNAKTTLKLVQNIDSKSTFKRAKYLKISFNYSWLIQPHGFKKSRHTSLQKSKTLREVVLNAHSPLNAQNKLSSKNLFQMPNNFLKTQNQNGNVSPKGQNLFSIAEKLRDKLHQKASNTLKKIEMYSGRSSTGSPEIVGVKCQTERISRKKKPVSLSSYVKAQLKPFALTLSPDLVFSKFQSEFSSSIKTPQTFRTMKPGQNPPKLLLFKNIV